MVSYQKLLRVGSRMHDPLSPKYACVWCQRQSNTRDHLVPRWFLKRLSAHMMADQNLRIVPSCGECNARKGGIPPAIYAKLLMIDYPRELRDWNTITEYYVSRPFDELPDLFIDFVVKAMQEPIELEALDAYINSGAAKKSYGNGLVWQYIPEKRPVVLDPPDLDAPRYAPKLGDLWPEKGS